jgi:Tfp pilus assembly major pilin PilA
MENTILGPLVRSYQQAKQAILTRFTSLIPEIRDYSEANPFIRMVSVFSALFELINLYIDNQVKESIPITASLYKSALIHARNKDYRVKGPIPSTVKVTLIISGLTADITIPSYTTVTCKSGVVFYTIDSVLIVAGTTKIDIECMEGERQASQSFTFDGNTSINLGLNVAEGSVRVEVDSVAYTFVDTFAFSNFEDKHFSTRILENEQTLVIFGDDANGLLPSLGSAIVADCNITRGSLGMIAPYDVSSIDLSGVSLPSGASISIYNAEPSTGGFDSEDIRSIIRKSIYHETTKRTAVTDTNYSQLAMLVPGVIRAKHDFKCGKTVPIYITTSGGLPTATLLKRVVLYFKTRKMVTTFIECKSAGIAELVLTIDVKASPDELNSAVRQLVIDRLVAEYAEENQDIKNSINLGDIYEIVENTKPQVIKSRVKVFNLRPAAIKGNDAYPNLLWERLTMQGSTQLSTWKIQFTGAGYKLLRNNQFIGNYLIGVAYTLPDLYLKVLANGYAVNDYYTFTLYPYNEDIDIQDMSIAVALAENLTINVTGGI